MNVLFWGVLTGAAAFLTHLAIWRIRLPKRQLRMVAIVFGAAQVLVLAAHGTALGPWLPMPLAGMPEAAAYLLFCTAWTLAYMITYTALEVDSPSLVIVDRIAGAGSGGLAAPALEKLVSDEQLVVPRVHDLVRDGMLAQCDGVFQLTSKGRRFIAPFETYRKLLGRERGG
jgi:hypothetical protein